ncbi:FAD-binding oxidoreductase [Lacimicrobium sp. SS2-24]|uniref:NAD(P)/FAD-dependent oxidoreductase n=1 Tax=Lacimicrobium sp. SS2-24 TaxID=2005569 RepID=UPI000B4A76E1|nr:FAD-binding oxidoreductase [Lacimicrobium sp. SS2-24]
MQKHTDSQQYYQQTCNQSLSCPTFSGEKEVDLCIIGGGLTGISTAYHSAKSGLDCVLLEAETIGFGASGRNGGQVSPGQRLDQATLEAKVGTAQARHLWQLALDSVDLVRELIDTYQIPCDFTPGILHTAFKPSHAQEMRENVQLLQSRYGYEDCRYIERDELSEMLASSRYHGGELDMRAGHLHPLNFTLGLALQAQKAGASLYENSRVLDIKSVGDKLSITTAQGKITTRKLVLGCNGYLGKLFPKVAGKIMPINNFIVTTAPLGEEQARALIRDNVAVADSKFVINYFRMTPDHRLLFGGGENYSSRFPADIKNFVRPYMLEIFPQLEDTELEHGWGGTLAITMNRMPHFQCLDERIYVAQGYSGHGVALATLAGKLIDQSIAGDPSGFNAMASYPTPTFPGGTLLRYPALVAGMLYYSLRDRFGN